MHYGLPNAGAVAVAERIGRSKLPVPLGVNLVKTNRGPGAAPERADQIIAEYVAAANSFARRADYLMLNLSCPNTSDGRDFFAERAHLDACLTALGKIEFRAAGLPESVTAWWRRNHRTGAGGGRTASVRLRLHVQPAAGQAG